MQQAKECKTPTRNDKKVDAQRIEEGAAAHNKQHDREPSGRTVDVVSMTRPPPPMVPPPPDSKALHEPSLAFAYFRRCHPGTAALEENKGLLSEKYTKAKVKRLSVVNEWHACSSCVPLTCYIVGADACTAPTSRFRGAVTDSLLIRLLTSGYGEQDNHKLFPPAIRLHSTSKNSIQHPPARQRAVHEHHWRIEGWSIASFCPHAP